MYVHGDLFWLVRPFFVIIVYNEIGSHWTRQDNGSRKGERKRRD